MAGAQGSGSALILRAKEARLRAQTADAVGLSTPLPTGQPATSVASISPMPVAPAQPVQPPNQSPGMDEMMYGHVEQFLQGLSERFNLPGTAPRGRRGAEMPGPGSPVAVPPVQVAPPPSPQVVPPAPVMGEPRPTTGTGERYNVPNESLYR